MAKRSHRRRRHHRVGAVHHRRRSRRHRISGVGDILTKVGGIGLGAVGVTFIKSAIQKAAPTMPLWIGGAAGVGLGLALPMVAKGNKILDYAAAGAAAMGVVFLLNETFLSLPGISGVATNPMFRGAGFVNQTVGYSAPGVLDETINGVRDLSVIGALYDN